MELQEYSVRCTIETCDKYSTPSLPALKKAHFIGIASMERVSIIYFVRDTQLRT